MNIIEFLLKNIYIVIAVLFVLSRLFSKSGSSKKPSQMPDFGGGSTSQPSTPASKAERPERANIPPAMRQAKPGGSDSQQVYRTQSDTTGRQSPPVVREPAQNAPYTAHTPPADASAHRRTTAGRTGAKAVSERAAAAHGRKVPLTSADLRTAVIWSEVLGQPRARRPFRK